MKLQQLFLNYIYENGPSLESVQHQDVSGLYFDANKVQTQSVFFAISGTRHDGHDFISLAVANGAIGLVVSKKEKVPQGYQGLVLVVDDVRLVLDDMAARFYNQPSLKMMCIGVTGTNGKTSITYILEYILSTVGKLSGVMGTINHRVGDQIWDSQMTTPDPVTLQSRLQDFLNAGAKAALMEVSSHALDQNRARSVHFNTAIFTNLTQDHLDYHKSMDEYFKAKQKLFTDLMWSSLKRPLFAVVNVDDKYGRKLKIADPVVVWTYGEDQKNGDDADFQFKIKKMDFSGTTFLLKTPVDQFEVTTPLTGKHNVYNVVACIAAALSCGVPIEKTVEVLKQFPGIPGRLQKVNLQSSRAVYVDYAHTPDALENTLQALHKIKVESQSTGDIICVFGCGGDRDKTKRPLMANIACRLSDKVIITSDNPRSEKPMDIIADILQGVSKGYQHVHVESDREQAIAWALRNAKANDIVLIAGKGHEDYQIIGDQKTYFSDVKVAEKYL